MNISETSPAQPTSQPTFRTTRLVLRPFRQSDLDRIVVLANDPEISANTRTFPNPYLPEHAEAFLAKHEPSGNQGNAGTFAICLRAQGESPQALIGAAGFEFAPEHERAELGYWIGSDFRNTGYCTEACRAMLDFGFNSLGLNKVCAHFLSRNPASGRVLEKIGMSCEGNAKSHVMKLGVLEDVTFMGLLKSDWNQR